MPLFSHRHCPSDAVHLSSTRSLLDPWHKQMWHLFSLHSRHGRHHHSSLCGVHGSTVWLRILQNGICKHLQYSSISTIDRSQLTCIGAWMLYQGYQEVFKWLFYCCLLPGRLSGINKCRVDPNYSALTPTVILPIFQQVLHSLQFLLEVFAITAQVSMSTVTPQNATHLWWFNCLPDEMCIRFGLETKPTSL